MISNSNRKAPRATKYTGVMLDVELRKDLELLATGDDRVLSSYVRMVLYQHVRQTKAAHQQLNP